MVIKGASSQGSIAGANTQILDSHWQSTKGLLIFLHKQNRRSGLLQIWGTGNLFCSFISIQILAKQKLILLLSAELCMHNCMQRCWHAQNPGAACAPWKNTNNEEKGKATTMRHKSDRSTVQQKHCYLHRHSHSMWKDCLHSKDKDMKFNIRLLAFLLFLPRTHS